jgi:putative transposase
MMQDDVMRAGCQRKLWDYFRSKSRKTLKRLLEAFMEHERDRFLRCDPFQRSAARRGYRNGFHQRLLDTSLGTIRLRMPRVRAAPQPFHTLVLERYQRRQRHLDDAVRDWVACGVSTRQVSRLMLKNFGALISPGTISRVVAEIDTDIRAFHTRSLQHGYQHVHFDAKHGYVSHKRKRRGRGKKKKAVLLLAWGRRHDGREELIDFRVTDSENEANWTDFMSNLEARGLKRRNRWDQKLEMIVSDGDGGLLSSLWMVYPNVPKQRCTFHKIQNITEHLNDRTHREAILASAGDIYRNLSSPRQAQLRLKRWQERWRELEPDAVRNFTYEFEDTLSYLSAPQRWHRRLKTNNPIERLIKELNRKANQIGIFPSSASWERCTWLVWQKLEQTGYAPTRAKNLFTQSS